MNDWTELKTGKEVFDRQAEDWEIEIFNYHKQVFEPWDGCTWAVERKYCGRPKQPRKVVVTSECWRNRHNGQLAWRVESCGWATSDEWKRFPAGDIVGEVEE